MRRGRAAFDFLEDLDDEEHAEEQVKASEAQYGEDNITRIDQLRVGIGRAHQTMNDPVECPMNASSLLTRRHVVAGAAALATGFALPARAKVPAPYDWNAAPPTEPRAAFIDWMVRNRGEDPAFLGKRWDPERIIGDPSSPTFKISLCTASRGASRARMIAWQMSSMWTSGRHGVPSLVILISLVVEANPARLFRTMSNRIRGLAPNAVALRKNTGEKLVSASAPTSRSTSTLHLA